MVVFPSAYVTVVGVEARTGCLSPRGTSPGEPIMGVMVLLTSLDLTSMLWYVSYS